MDDDIAIDHGVIVPIPEDSMLHPLLHNKVSLDRKLLSNDGGKQEDMKQLLPPWLEYASSMIHLAVFGILGVITRYWLQKVFGLQGIGATHDGSILYLDLPSNMIGSFLMGWFGVVFKTDIVNVSDQLAIGLSTGYLGSLTTFSGWNQEMLDLSVEGHWIFAILGFLLGLFLVAYSIILGIETAQGTRWLFQRLENGNEANTPCPKHNFRVNTYWHHMVIIIVLVLMWGALWALSVTMETREFHDGGTKAQLWLGCLVGPFGVWIRWWLARFNGRGLGRTGLGRWLPLGTLMANVSAACMMAALATLKKAVNTETSVTVASGVQFGFLGCLSTVSTMMAEFNAMRAPFACWLRENILDNRFEGSTEWRSLFAMGIWWIWRWRNDKAFNDVTVTCEKSRFITDWAKEYQQATGTSTPSISMLKSLQAIAWTKPPDGWVKMNTDGAVKEGALSAAGGVLRDKEGQWISGFVHRIGSCSVPMAELWGVRNGLQMAWDLGYRQVMVESDSQLVINLINSSIKKCHPLCSLVLQCQGLISRDWTIRFRHVYREANTVADRLASLAFSYSFGFHVLLAPPEGINLLLHNDVRGRAIPRLLTT